MKTKLMGILNVTPNSYYAPSRALSSDQAVDRGIQMWKEGADLIDIGGESTFPGTPPVSEQEELERVIPVIKQLSKEITIPISIDTMKAAVAEQALIAGASILNDVTGFQDPKMVLVALKYDVPICIMHMQGTPQSMEASTDYPEGVVPSLIKWFEAKIAHLKKQGIKEKNIIIDPGIGFGKTVAQNHEIIHNLPKLKAFGYPLLLGVSRKLLIRKLLNKPPEEILSATIAMNTLGILLGANIIRVHDVKEHRDVIDILYMSQNLAR